MDAVAARMTRRGFLGLLGAAALAGTVARAEKRVAVKGFTKVQDLTHPLSPNFPMWPGFDPIRITPLVTVEQNGFYGNRVDFWEHSGTHMDAPAHFDADGPTAEQLPVERLFAPLAVIHIAERAAKDPDAQLTPDDILAWERRYDRLPAGAFVAMYSGWEQHASNAVRYRNMDASGTMHFPGFHPDAAAMLIEEREITGIGVDTLSLDFGASTDFKTHLTVLPAGKYGLENLAHLGELPPAGATIIVGAPKHQGASGGPVRAFAVWD
ncbi:cyclase family protein [Marinithermus hydrothermalis]|nr:cyclase family protein [Marinithermus hydrothermalis]